MYTKPKISPKKTIKGRFWRVIFSLDVFGQVCGHDFAIFNVSHPPSIVRNLLLIVRSAFNTKSDHGKSTVAFSSISDMNLAWKNLLTSLPEISSILERDITVYLKGVSSKLIYRWEIGQPYRQCQQFSRHSIQARVVKESHTYACFHFRCIVSSSQKGTRPFHSMVVVHFISGLASN